MMAGLCHDLGHGPFSHLWESFVREARPGHEWCHEKTSIDMLDYIIQVLLVSRRKQIKISFPFSRRMILCQFWIPMV